jgi:hypothetical protein
MRLTPVKRKILKEMASLNQARRPKQIAERVGVNFSSCMMHILGLKKLGYVSSPMKGYYKITELGREVVNALVSSDKAASILTQFDPDKTFYFYSGIGHYSGVRADSLLDFSEKIKDISVESLEFHLFRKDFENWLENIGDVALASKLAAIREKRLSGEKLRDLVYKTVKARYNILQDSLDEQ